MYCNTPNKWDNQVKRSAALGCNPVPFEDYKGIIRYGNFQSVLDYWCVFIVESEKVAQQAKLALFYDFLFWNPNIDSIMNIGIIALLSNCMELTSYEKNRRFC